jgi:DNA-binding NarL/FixJ family response regulator
MPIRVLIADDHAVVRLGVVKLLELLGGGEIAVVGEVADGESLLDTVAALSPDVLLLDIVMPGLDVVAHVRQVVDLKGGPRVLMLTNHDRDDYVLPLVAAGISGYLLKDEIPDAIVQAIRAVAEGGTWFSQRIAGLIARSTYTPAQDAESAVGAAALTPREWEILQHIAQGHSNSDIADQLRFPRPPSRIMSVISTPSSASRRAPRPCCTRCATSWSISRTCSTASPEFALLVAGRRLQVAGRSYDELRCNR